MDFVKNKEMEFVYGVGFIDFVRVLNSGFVYEIYKEDYIKLLCFIGYSQESMRLIIGDKNVICFVEKIFFLDFNYFLIVVDVGINKFKVDVYRNVINVGFFNFIY